ncbi:hypothetical protein HWV62_23502 [Athelia sp. TMB]|nr:hypothetical protein HWV62_23502 [Athelia sp. TMB]
MSGVWWCGPLYPDIRFNSTTPLNTPTMPVSILPIVLLANSSAAASVSFRAPIQQDIWNPRTLTPLQARHRPASHPGARAVYALMRLGLRMHSKELWAPSSQRAGLAKPPSDIGAAQIGSLGASHAFHARSLPVE